MRDKRIPNLSHLVAFFASDGIYFCNCLTNGLIFHDYKSILGDRKTNKKIYHSFLTELKQKRKYLQPMHLASLHCRMVQPSKNQNKHLRLKKSECLDATLYITKLSSCLRKRLLSCRIWKVSFHLYSYVHLPSKTVASHKLGLS